MFGKTMASADRSWCEAVQVSKVSSSQQWPPAQVKSGSRSEVESVVAKLLSCPRRMKMIARTTAMPTANSAASVRSIPATTDCWSATVWRVSVADDAWDGLLAPPLLSGPTRVSHDDDRCGRDSTVGDGWGLNTEQSKPPPTADNVGLAPLTTESWPPAPW